MVNVTYRPYVTMRLLTLKLLLRHLTRPPIRLDID
jgi:hypothetical protein